MSRELQEELYLDKARESLVGFTVGSHMMAPNPLNTRTTAELERVDSERYHIGGVVTVRTTTKMVTEVVIEGNNTYNPSQIMKMADEVIKYLDLLYSVIKSVLLVGS